MIDIDIKDKINNVVITKYGGSLRFLKPKLTIDLIGVEALKHIQSRIDKNLQSSHTLMLYCYLNDIYENPKCVCGLNVKFNTTTKEFMKYCSNKCRFDNQTETIKIRQQTNLTLYGSTNYLSSELGKAKIKKTNIAKYGVDNYAKTDEYKEKMIGNKDSDIVKHNKKVGMLKKSYNELISKFTHCKLLFTFNEYSGVKGYIQYSWNCNKCNADFVSSCDNGSSPICNHCKPTGSMHEIVCKQFIDKFKIDYKFRYRGLPSGKEIDIYVDDKKFGIELCGLFYHSTAGFNYAKPNHINKLTECEENGIKLFTVFDDEMYNLNKRRIVLNKIKNSLGEIKNKIYARKCKIIEIGAPTSEKFLNKYHIQGSIGSSYKYGLTYNNRLVAVMTFNKGRTATGHKSKDGHWELGRYCTIFNFSIVGGAGKLLQHFIRTVDPTLIYSYADRRWSNGNLYSKLGFDFIKNTTPNYWYTKTFKTREHRVKYQKHKLINMPSYKEELTEEEIMKLEKYYKIWDCGSKLYVWNKS